MIIPWTPLCKQENTGPDYPLCSGPLVEGICPKAGKPHSYANCPMFASTERWRCARDRSMAELHPLHYAMLIFHWHKLEQPQHCTNSGQGQARQKSGSRTLIHNGLSTSLHRGELSCRRGLSQYLSDKINSWIKNQTRGKNVDGEQSEKARLL